MNLREIYDYCRKSLAVEDADFEAKQIVCEVCSVSYSDLIKNHERPVTKDEITLCTQYVERRNAHEPLYYILGKTEFYSLPFYVGKGVLIPRQDSEIIVEKALEYLKADCNTKKARILDLCAGSGCLSVAVAKNFCDCTITAVEKYDEAYNYLCKNIKLNSCENVVAKMADALKFSTKPYEYDLVISNPPYIRIEEKQDLQPEVLCEPHTALFAEENGLFFYRIITENFKNSGAEVMFEISDEQKDDVIAIFKNNGYSNISVHKDYNGKNRVVTAFATI